MAHDVTTDEAAGPLSSPSRRAVLAGAGATALVAGVVVYLMGNSEGRPPGAHLALAPQRNGGEVVWSCAF